MTRPADTGAVSVTTAACLSSARSIPTIAFCYRHPVSRRASAHP